MGVSYLRIRNDKDLIELLDFYDDILTLEYKVINYVYILQEVMP